MDSVLFKAFEYFIEVVLESEASLVSLSRLRGLTSCDRDKERSTAPSGPYLYG